MKIDVTPKEAAAVYIGKAVALLDTACELYGETCKDCPLSNGPRIKCKLGELKTHLYGQ